MPNVSEEIVVPAGYFSFPEAGIISVNGRDSLDFLQRLSTQSFKSPLNKKILFGAFLTGRAWVVSLGYFLQPRDNEVFFICREGVASALAHLESMHFGETLEIKNLSSEWSLWGVVGLQRSSLSAGAASEWTGLTFDDQLGGWEWGDAVVPELAWRLQPRNAPPPSEGIPLLPTDFERLRLRHGLPELGKELLGKELLLEAGLEIAVARNKGCYPGQEVVERIFTYGSVNRKLCPVKALAALSVASGQPLPLFSEGIEVGQLLSAIIDSPVGAPRPVTVGLAYLKKGFWAAGTNLTTEKGEPVVVRPAVTK